MRNARIVRETLETKIDILLELDGHGKCDLENPIGFFDHLLKSFCKHGLFDISGKISGDLQVDEHHLIEDTGIVLGQCFLKALGDFSGIKRAGFFIFPMDESLLQASVDFGGRPFCICNAALSGIPLVSVASSVQSSFQCDCFEDFWQGFANGAKCNIHLDTIRGRSDHHKMEGLFKATARAIRSAIKIDERQKNEIPSAKGVIV